MFPEIASRIRSLVEKIATDTAPLSILRRCRAKRKPSASFEEVTTDWYATKRLRKHLLALWAVASFMVRANGLILRPR